MKILFTMLLVVALAFGGYHGVMAVYGWFEMMGVTDEVAKAEIPTIVDRVQQGGLAALDTRDRFVKIRDGILKGAKEAGVALNPDDVVVTIADNMLDVRLSWDAPLAVFQGKSYLDIPMTLQRTYPLAKRP